MTTNEAERRGGLLGLAIAIVLGIAAYLTYKPTTITHDLTDFGGVACALIQTNTDNYAFFENDKNRPGRLLATDKLWMCRK